MLSEGGAVSAAFHLYIDARRLSYQPAATCLGVGLGGTLSYRRHLAALGAGVVARCALVRRLVGGDVERVRRRPAPLPWRLCVRRLGAAPGMERRRTRRPAGCEFWLQPACSHWMLAAGASGRLPVLAGFPPVGLRGRAVGLALGRCAVDPGRLLRHAVAGG